MLGLLAAFTLALSAALVSLAQPFMGKELLPLAGGTPAVWTTCLVTFQALLLAGYFYADRLTRLPGRVQVPVHLVVLLLAAGLGVLGRAAADATWMPADQDNPVAGLMAYLLARVGAPFWALTATAPLVSRWAAGRLQHPYRLYAASNAGSLLGLLAYPVVVEPWLTLSDQARIFGIGFGLTAGLIGVCGLIARPQTQNVAGAVSPAPPGWVRWKWLGLAALPASLLAAVTVHLTTDIAPVPLVWVGPLALYLLSFVIVFAGWSNRAAETAGRILAMGLTFLAVALATRAAEPMVLVAGLHLGVFFLACLVCHGELARSRPGADRLTGFYLLVAVGGVLGGFVNAVLAPVVFSALGTVEYPLAVVLVALVRPGRGGGRFLRRDAAWVGGFGLLTAALILGVGAAWPAMPNPDTDAGTALLHRLGRAGLLFGVPAAAAFALVIRPLRFAACLAVLLTCAALDPGPHGRVLWIHRNFFGTVRVTESPDGQFVRLVHGTTQHGQQTRGEVPPTPLMYYHPTGPAGRVLSIPGPPRTVAAVGLGCGALAAYVRPGEQWTFYEIDPAVVRIARDERYFQFLSSTPTPLNVVLGDARRTLARTPAGTHDVIVLDAFNSDAVPVHLLTVEAFAGYTEKLTPNGIILAHLSNAYLDLPPLFARVAAAHDPPFQVWVDDDSPTDTQRAAGKTRSVWAVAVRRPEDVPGLNARWQPARVTPGPVWRDDFADLLRIWKRGE